MLIDEPRALELNLILAFLAKGSHSRRIETGCYEIGHFGSSNFLPGYNQYPEFSSFGPYGVCDSLEQLKEKCTELQDPDRKFVVTLTRVNKAEQPEEGGWRWHKWGDYIGTHNPKHEYLYDEEDIEFVYCYHIYEKEK